MKNMTINPRALGKLMRMLTQYEDAPSAVIREYVSNAYDAIQDVDNGHINVVLPDVEHRILAIEDNGCGMSYDFMNSQLSSYLTTTKNGNGNSIGSKGIGSKSAFSIADEYTVVSVRNGQKTTCVYHINDDDECGYEISQEATHAHNGTSVSIEINDDRSIARINSAVSDTLQGFNGSMITVVSHNNKKVHVDYFGGRREVALSDDLSIDINHLNAFSIIQGNVWYTITNSAFEEMLEDYFYNNNEFRDMFTTYSHYSMLGFVVRLRGNALTTNPSREFFEATDHNVSIVVDVFRRFMNGLKARNMQILELFQHVLSNSIYAKLSYEQARGFCLFINRRFKKTGFPAKDIKLGGTALNDFTISAPLFSAGKYYRDRSSRISGAAINKCDTMELRPDAIDAFNAHVFMSGIESMEQMKRVIKRYRIWFAEYARENARWLEHSVSDIYDFTFSQHSLKRDIPLWVRKRDESGDHGFNILYTTYEDFERLMQHHDEELAERRRQRRIESKNASIKKEVEVSSLYFGRISFGVRKGASSRSTLASLIADGTPLFHVDNDTYRIFREMLFNSHIGSHRYSDFNDFSLLLHMSEKATYGTASFIIICDRGTKNTMSQIERHSRDYFDAYKDYKAIAARSGSNANVVYDNIIQEIARNERSRILTNIFSVNGNIWNVLTDKNIEGIRNEKTRESMNALRMAHSRYSDARYDNSGTQIDEIANLKRLGVAGTNCCDMGSMISVINDFDYFASRYPMIKMSRNSESEFQKYIDDIIDYINMYDKQME